MLRLLLLSAFLHLSVSAFTQLSAADLGQLQTSFMARYDEANAERDASLKRLDGSYLAALKKLEDQLKGAGDLDRILPVRDEIEAVEANADALPDLPDKRPAQLSGMRNKFTGARDKVLMDHARELVSLVEKMEKVLSEQESRLTREGDVDGALAARKMSDTLEADAGIQNARKLLGRAGGDASAAAGDSVALDDFLPGTVWTYESGPKKGEAREGFLLFLEGGRVLNTLPNAGLGTWELVGGKIAITIKPYPTSSFTVSEDRRSLNGDDEQSRRRASLHAVPVTDE